MTMEKGPLKNQTALVTGANSGIGEAIARAMGRCGANVVINYTANEDAAEKIADEIRQGGASAAAIKADVSREEEVAAMFSKADETFGGIDILVSNAGIQKDSPFTEMTLEKWNAVIGVNLTGAFLCAREAARRFLKQGVVAGRSASAGKIIFISSVHDTIPWAGHVNYAASKGGMQMLMKSVAQELASSKVRANCISPGAIKTNINRAAWETPEAEAELEKLIPYGRVGTAEDVARAAVWLASDDAEYLTGTTIYVDGGMLLYPGFRTGG